MKCRAHNLLLTWHRTQCVDLNSIPCGAQARLSPATGVSPFSGNCRGKLPCYCFWLPVGFSWPASMDGTFTSLGLPWELSPSPPRTPLAEGTHPLQPLLLSTDILFFFFNCSGFCHTLKWISHGFTCVPHPDPPSHLPFHPIHLGLPSAPGPSACLMHPTWVGHLFHPG